MKFEAKEQMIKEILEGGEESKRHLENIYLISEASLKEIFKKFVKEQVQMGNHLMDNKELT